MGGGAGEPEPDRATRGEWEVAGGGMGRKLGWEENTNAKGRHCWDGETFGGGVWGEGMRGVSEPRNGNEHLNLPPTPPFK